MTNRTRRACSGSKPLRTLRLRGEAIQCASNTLADSRVQKPKNFLAFFSRLLPPPLHREAEKEMERKFLVLLRRFSLRKEQSYFNILFALLSALTATEALSYPRSVVTLTSANHTQTPPHSPLAFARAGCFGVVCVRLVASVEFSGNSKSCGLC